MQATRSSMETNLKKVLLDCNDQQGLSSCITMQFNKTFCRILSCIVRDWLCPITIRQAKFLFLVYKEKPYILQTYDFELQTLVSLYRTENCSRLNRVF
nr:MAG TPA: hypothetical protein [Caudoviricetes sp.]